MRNMGISTDPTLLNVEQHSIIVQSPSTSTFLPEEDASICPLLPPNTPSPPLMTFSHPLTPNIHNDSNDSVNCTEDNRADTSSSSSSGIGVVVTDTATSTLFNKHAYQHLKKNDIFQESGQKQNGLLNIQLDKNTPSFVSWNWPLIRKCTFFAFMSSLLAMCAIVTAMIVTMPRTCNPKTAWYRGSVLYEIFPASFQDSNNDGMGDIRGIINRLDYLKDLGLGGIRLNSIFPSKHYPDHWEMVTNISKIDNVLGDVNDLAQLSSALHSRNMSLILDLPLYPYLEQLDITDTINTSTTSSNMESSSKNQNFVTEAMRHWLSKGIDGFYVKGLEYFIDDPNLVNNIAEWKYVLGQDRVLMVSYDFIEKIDQKYIQDILQYIDLVDVHLNVSNGTHNMYKQIKSIIDGVLKPIEDGPWIQWSLGGVSSRRLSNNLNPNATLAATLLQLMLPGTPSIFYGDEISLEESYDPQNEHIETKHLHHLSTMIWNGTNQFTNKESLPWLPKGASVEFNNFDKVAKMIYLREQAPSIYKNSFSRDGQTIQNTNIKHSKNDIFVIERYYPRRNSFVSVSNFGQKTVSMDLTSMFYSGKVMIGPISDEKIYFDKFMIEPMETIIVKLDK